MTFAQPAVNENLLGLSADALKDAFPAAQQILKPVKGPHGERGLWRLANSELAGQRFESTFYFKSRLIQRIEQHWTSVASSCAAPYLTLISELDANYGTGIHASDDAATQGPRQSSAWVSEKFKVMAYEFHYPDHCDLLVAFEPHQEKDASQL
jgi:hypothetical protein